MINLEELDAFINYLEKLNLANYGGSLLENKKAEVKAKLLQLIGSR